MNPNLYRVFAGVKKRGKTVYSKALKIRNVSYNNTMHSVTINLAKSFKGAVQVTVEAGLTAASGVSTSSGFVKVVQ